MSMAYPIVEAAGAILSGRVVHPVTGNFPWAMSVLEAKANWWQHEVHTIAREDEHKYPNGILSLAWAEYLEAVAAPQNEQLVELGDIMVFLAAAMARDSLTGQMPNGVLLMEQMYLARYVDQELGKMGESTKTLVPKMVEQVFTKLGNNFHTQLNPPIPETAPRKSVGRIYQQVYLASREMRKHAKDVMGLSYDGNVGMPKEWRSVYSTNGHTPPELQQVRDLALVQMKKIGTTYKGELGEKATSTILREYWVQSAPGMIGELTDLF